ncbi:MAG TPA: CbiX/SirB N-terminal domain-containing protein [Aquabacterium sp.]|uniref:sirohydrochlorin chelatase n=1 Tax=Aquabacterium sp. TaxID=1872578 RepID=UPI002E32270C|nr:CbiX/SirB N-terminal domain-containing protein [Aquabacterium sp.]HEX5373187.1 CbiX/SirB N-terminal domain-containing protein [Aquabacterium sp.]
MTQGILLFAHGARDPAWARPFEQARDRLIATRGPSGPVDLAFLEFMSPTLVEAGARMAAQGCTQVTVVPLFLGAGGHVRKDLPLLLQQLGEQHPGVRWTLSPAVGETDILVQALADAAAHLAAQHRGAP